MTSFGQLRNSLGRLAELNKNMGILSHLKISKNFLEQTHIKNQPILFYLQILHFIYTEYSPELYKAILELSPNIKTLPDHKFVETCFSISRKMFNINSKITVEQFFQQGKLIEKRLEWLVDLVEEVYKWQNKSKSKLKSSKEIKGAQYSKEVVASQNVEDDLDDEDLQVRQINIKPTQFNFEPSFVPTSKITPMRQYEDQSPKIANKATKANVFPKNIIQNNYISDEEQPEEYTKVITSKNLHKIPKQNIKENPKQTVRDKLLRQVEESNHNAVQVQDESSYVTREEYNELVGMLASMNETITSLVSKFNTFQNYTSGELTKFAARISLVQQNVKIIKANI